MILVLSNREDLMHLSQMVQEGRLRTVVDSTFPLSQMQAAHSRSEQGHARGKIIIDVGNTS